MPMGEICYQSHSISVHSANIQASIARVYMPMCWQRVDAICIGLISHLKFFCKGLKESIRLTYFDSFGLLFNFFNLLYFYLRHLGCHQTLLDAPWKATIPVSSSCPVSLWPGNSGNMQALFTH